MNRKIRSGLLTLVAAIFALAVVIAPTRAMAVETVVADDSGSYSTPYGTISYIPDANGYNLTVEVYVNFEAEPVARVQLPKVANGNGSNHNLGFEPADGLYYHGGAGATYSYELITSAGGTWTESTDNLYFNTIEDTQKNYDNVLRINLFTFSVADRALLAVSAFNRPVMLGDNNPHDHVEGYIVTYTDYDPVTQQNQTYSFEVRDTEAGGTIDFVDPPIPQGKDIDITLICDEGYEAALWQSGTALSTVVGDEGTADNAGIAVYDGPAGNVLTINVGESDTNPLISVAEVRPAKAPNSDKDLALLSAEVNVDCTNGYAVHDAKTYSLTKDDGDLTFDEAIGSGASRSMDVTVNNAQDYVDSYNTDIADGHTLVDTEADRVINFVHDGTGWKAQAPLNLEVTCNDGPSAPSEGEILAGIGKVEVECVNPDVNHMTGYYDAIAGSYTTGEVEKSADGSYTYTVTVNDDAYVSAYNTNTGTTHTISGEGSKTVIFVNDGSGWTVRSGTPVGFEVVCETPAPELPTEDGLEDILGNEFSVNVNCTNADAQHEGESYGIIPGGVTISGPVKGEDGTYTTLVSFNTNQYVVQYSVDKGYSAHELVSAELQPVTLTWNGSEWTAPSDLAAQTLSVKCSEDNTTPVGPTGDEVEALLKGAITVDCTNGEVEHQNATYDLKPMTWKAGEVTENADGSYTVDVTVAPGEYVLQFEKDTQGIHHWVAPDGQTGTITLVYVASADGNGGSWQVVEGKGAVTFTVLCEIPTTDPGTDPGTDPDDPGTTDPDDPGTDPGTNPDNPGDNGNGGNQGNTGDKTAGDKTANADDANSGSKLPKTGDATSFGIVTAVALAGAAAAGTAFVAHRRQQ